MLTSSNIAWSQESNTPAKDSTHTVKIDDIRTAGQIFKEHRRFLDIILENEITINSLQETVMLLQKDNKDSKSAASVLSTLNEICQNEKVDMQEKHALEIKQIKKSKTTVTIIAVVTTLTTIALLVK